ncbi:MAG: TIGR02646 family protein [Flavobacteriales bacterium]|nr:TIGR02646 family protein [Flavobacteriales bacterium]MCB0778804.1 TIGR02646 family protein [Flavobacteriales bacterium]MCB0808338.1 TIGR02646 family protein [Flavobacteriales bacterium]HPF90975.1 TIGR02646 family protein [Flavobacteriales bacterium]
MVKLVHRNPEPVELTAFNNQYPHATPQDWGRDIFQPAKIAVKAALNQDQGGLCVYCEKKLNDDHGHVEHIKPKAGPNGHPHLCYVYTNHAQSCMTHNTCGQRKGNELLPIEPGPGCNAGWSLSTDGTIEAAVGITQERQTAVEQTRDILGLNDNAELVDERRAWFEAAIEVEEEDPSSLPGFLSTAPYRYILSTVF